MTGEAGGFERLRTEFLRIRGSVDSNSERDADLFILQLESLVAENPASERKSAKIRDRKLVQARAALRRARNALSALDATQLYTLLRGKMSAAPTLLRQFENVASLSREFDVGSEGAIDVEFESRAITIVIGLRHVFRIFGLRISDSDSSFAAWCLGEIFKAAGIDATPDSVRAHLRRTAKIGQK